MPVTIFIDWSGDDEPLNLVVVSSNLLMKRLRRYISVHPGRAGVSARSSGHSRNLASFSCKKRYVARGVPQRQVALKRRKRFSATNNRSSASTRSKDGARPSYRASVTGIHSPASDRHRTTSLLAETKLLAPPPVMVGGYL